jgi:hypothetical protein
VDQRRVLAHAALAVDQVQHDLARAAGRRDAAHGHAGALGVVRMHAQERVDPGLEVGALEHALVGGLA